MSRSAGRRDGSAAASRAGDYLARGPDLLGRVARAYGSRPSFARAADQLWFQRKIGRMIGVR